MRKILSLVTFPSFFLAIVLFGLLYREQLLIIFYSPERLRGWILSTNLLAPILFIFVQTIQVIVFFIPGEVPQIAGGYLFGVWKGSLLSIIGIAIGSMFSFLLSRFLGIPFVYALFDREKVEAVRKISGSHKAKISFFLFFLIPGIPKDILCYAGGLSPMKLHQFLVLSTLGRLPGIIGSAFMGDAAAERKWILAGVVFFIAIILFILGFLFRGKIQSYLERFSTRNS